MEKFMDDLTRTIIDMFKFIIFLLAGALIAGVLLILIAKFFELFH